MRLKQTTAPERRENPISEYIFILMISWNNNNNGTEVVMTMFYERLRNAQELQFFVSARFLIYSKLMKYSFPSQSFKWMEMMHLAKISQSQWKWWAYADMNGNPLLTLMKQPIYYMYSFHVLCLCNYCHLQSFRNILTNKVEWFGWDWKWWHKSAHATYPSYLSAIKWYYDPRA